MAAPLIEFCNSKLTYFHADKGDWKVKFVDIDHGLSICSHNEQIFEGFQIFVELQRHIKTQTLDSEKFSSIIAEFRSCLQNRLNSYELPLDETHNTENFLPSLFDLIQIFLLSDTENLACFSMIEWFRNKYNKSLVQNQSDLTLKFEEILFWKTIYGWLCCGGFEQAASLLYLHPDYLSSSMNNVFKSLEDILINWPEFLNNNDSNELKTRIEIFQTQIRNMKSKNLFNNSFLNHLSNLLLGLSIDFDILESNFERKVVCHIFNDPTISICELIKKFQEFEPQSTLDRIYNCLIKRDFCDFFQTVDSQYNHLFYIVHVCDFLFQYFISNLYFANKLHALRNKMLYRYSCILYDRGFWEIATHYMSYCDSLQSQQIPLYLNKFCTNEKRILKIIQLLNRLDISDNELIINNLLNFYIQNHLFGNALIFSLKLKNHYWINFIINKFFEQYTHANIPPSLDLLGALKQSDDFNYSLITYIKLCEYYNSIQSKSDDIHQKLLTLLESVSSSRPIILQLILNAVLLHVKENFIGTDRNYSLLQYLNCFELSNESSPETFNHQQSCELETSMNFKEVIHAIRQVLVKNLTN